MLLDDGLASFLSTLRKALGFLPQLCKIPACFQKATPEQLKFCQEIWWGDNWGSTWSFLNYKKPDNRQDKANSFWYFLATANGSSPLPCLSLFSHTLGEVVRNANFELFIANFSHGNSSVQKVTVQLHILYCFCTVDLLEKKKLKRGSKEEYWVSCLSLTERIHMVHVRPFLWMADSYMVMKSHKYLVLKALAFTGI